MKVTADYNGIDSLGNYMVSEADDFNAKIDHMINKIEELEMYWSGPDYDNYKEVYETYLKNLKTTYIELNAFGHALKKVSYYYNDLDSNFGDKMRKMGNVDDKKHVRF